LPVDGAFDGALRAAAVSLEELRGQDEPVFTGMAAFTAGSLQMALGRYDDALRHLRDARDLAERPGGNWLAASPSARTAPGRRTGRAGRPLLCSPPADC